jgi:uncharacterized delta-60 repeat protein
MDRRRRSATSVALSLMLVLGAGGIARAATPGTLDPSFGSGGVAAPSGVAQLFGVAVQSNGDVVAAGQSTAGSAIVERLTSSGQPDPSFGSGGQATGPAGTARAVAIQPDGKIVFAGTSGGSMFVERLNTNGTEDSSFGVQHAFGGSAVANGVAIQPDGKIVIAGSVNPIDTRIALARFNSNGAVDTTFGSGGTDVFGPLAGLTYEAAQAVTVQPDGKIVFVGHGAFDGDVFLALVARLNANGSLDAGFNPSAGGVFFGSGGVITYKDPNSGYVSLNAVALQNDGKIVAAGAGAGNPPFAIFVRLNPDGSSDSSFGSSGVSELSSGTFTASPYGAYGVGIGGGGAVIGAGAVQLNNSDHRAGLWATAPNGAPEAGFGSGGVVAQPGGIESCGLAVAPDGNLVIVGHAVPAIRSQDPCLGADGSGGFIARYIGFGPPPPPAAPGSAPTVSTGSASGISEVAATVAGQVNPNGLATAYSFDYGTSSSYGSSTPVGSVAAGTTSVPVTATLTGLTPDTTYHYRIDANNSAGSTTGPDETFTTNGPPSASTGSAGSITEVSARISGHVDPGGLDTTYHVDFGTTTAYGSKTPTAKVSAASGQISISATVRGLRPGTTYHYRLVAANSAGARYGSDKTFKTLPSLRTTVKGVAGSYSISTLAGNGAKLKVGCNQACSIQGSVYISSKSAKRLGLGTHAVTVARGTASLRRTGTVTLVLKLTKGGKSDLTHHHGVSVTLKLVWAPRGGGKSHTVFKTVKLT